MPPNDFAKYPFANPTTEYAAFKGWDDDLEQIDRQTDVSNHDLLVAFLRSADAIFHELRCIRTALEKRA